MSQKELSLHSAAVTQPPSVGTRPVKTLAQDGGSTVQLPAAKSFKQVTAFALSKPSRPASTPVENESWSQPSAVRATQSVSDDSERLKQRT